MPELDTDTLLRLLERHGVRYVLTGSAAAAAYGVAITPADLDLAPELAPGNLARIAALLREVGARPKHVPEWREGPSREQCDAWQPDPASEQNLDHRFVTPHGELDVVPRRSGTFAALAPRARRMTISGVPVLVAHLDDLIAQSRAWSREKDRARLEALLDARERPRGGARAGPGRAAPAARGPEPPSGATRSRPSARRRAG